MGIALWPEPIAVLRKHILVLWHNDADCRLLQHPVDNRWDSQQSFLFVALRYFLAPYGLRVIFALAYQFCKFVPVFVQVRFQLFYAHGINSPRPFVAYYLSARLGKVSGTQNGINGLHTFSLSK